jgi:hypothetical protein
MLANRKPGDPAVFTGPMPDISLLPHLHYLALNNHALEGTASLPQRLEAFFAANNRLKAIELPTSLQRLQARLSPMCLCTSVPAYCMAGLACSNRQCTPLQEHSSVCLCSASLGAYIALRFCGSVGGECEQQSPARACAAIIQPCAVACCARYEQQCDDDSATKPVTRRWQCCAPALPRSVQQPDCGAPLFALSS